MYTITVSLPHEILAHSFKAMSLKAAMRTAVPTMLYYLMRSPLPKSEKPALFTMNILPPMMTVWYHFARKALGDRVDYVIFDCSGKLDPKDFPGARVQKFLNFYAATKSDEFLKHIAKNRKIGWICDDDMFPMSGEMLNVLEREFRDTKTASVSFRPRDWWRLEIDGKSYEPSSSYCTALNREIFVDREFRDSKTASVSFRPRDWWRLEIDGKSYEPSSSYCTALNREIFVDREHLSLAPANGNAHPSNIGKPPVRYDTFDKANEILIRKGYRCAIVPKEERDRYLTGFSGMSGAVALLGYFKTPEQTLAYYQTPPKETWSGNVLFGTLSSMLAVWTILELYERITGKKYVIPSLPERSLLEKIREDHKQYLRSDQSLTWFDDVRTRLLREL